VPGYQPRPRVQLPELGVVVEHLLEVGDEPDGIRRIPREPAADHVVHPAGRHPVERRREHVPRLRPASDGHSQQELERRRLWELRRPAESAPRLVERPAQRRQRLLEELGRERLGRRRGGRCPRDRVEDAAPLLLHVAATIPPRLGDPLEHLPERREPVGRLLGKVRAGEERLTFRREEGRQGPATLSGHGLDGIHVDRVQIGTLLAVHLDRDEVPVEKVGGLGVLERLALHDVAPVARRVPDRQEDRTILPGRLRQRLVAPREPVHGVLGVL
jgi:hypothetical protein